jgi:hypothetical protein
MPSGIGTASRDTSALARLMLGDELDDPVQGRFPVRGGVDHLDELLELLATDAGEFLEPDAVLLVSNKFSQRCGFSENRYHVDTGCFRTAARECRLFYQLLTNAMLTDQHGALRLTADLFDLTEQAANRPGTPLGHSDLVDSIVPIEPDAQLGQRTESLIDLLRGVPECRASARSWSE